MYARYLPEGHINCQHRQQYVLLTQGCKHSQHQLQLRLLIEIHLQNAFAHCARHFVRCNTQYNSQAHELLNFGVSKHKHTKFHLQSYSSCTFHHLALKVYKHIKELRIKRHVSGTESVPALSLRHEANSTATELVRQVKAEVHCSVHKSLPLAHPAPEDSTLSHFISLRSTTI
jgi:hypothetical protein